MRLACFYGWQKENFNGYLAFLEQNGMKQALSALLTAKPDGIGYP